MKTCFRDDFLPFFTRHATFVTSICFSVHQATSETVSTLKRKSLLPFGAFRVDPFSEGRQNKFDNCLP